MQQNLRARFAKYLQHRPNFIKVWGTTFGVAFAVVELWMFGKYGGVGWWLFLAVLAVPAGWVWAFLMWHVMEHDIRRLSSSDSTTRKLNNGSRD